MHNLGKIRLFRTMLWILYPLAWLVIKPFVRLRVRDKSSLFFFFDRYSIGGAQRVHLDILQSVSDIPKRVFFTRKSTDDKLRDEFYSQPNTINSDIHIWCDNVLLRLFSTHYFAFYLNQHGGSTIFSSNSTFFYDMLPFLNRSIYRIELLHNYTFGKNGMEFFGLANYQFLDQRLVIDVNTKKNIEQTYVEHQVPQFYFQRIKVIEFGVDIPTLLNKKITQPLRILYAGRGGRQKRVWLINEIAEHFIKIESPVEFHFAGPIEHELSEMVKQRSIIHGSVSSKSGMNELFCKCNVLLLTSAYEGFPVVIKEAMAHGCVPVVTALPGNLTHLIDLQNALLIHSIEDESAVVREGILRITELLSNEKLLERLSLSAYEYASANFRKENFMKQYRNILTKKMAHDNA